MSDEEKTTDIVNAEDTPSEEEGGSEEFTIEESFRHLYGDAQSMQSRLMRIAQSADEEKNSTKAEVVRILAGDVMPLISDLIAESGSAFEEVGQVAEEAHEANVDLSDEDLVQIYVTLMSNERAFAQLVDATSDEDAKKGLGEMVKINQNTMQMLQEQFGEELVEAAESKIKEAAAAP